MLGVLGLVAVLAVVAGTHELLVLVGAGALMGIVAVTRSRSGPPPGLLFGGIGGLSSAGATVTASAAAAASFGLLPLFLIFVKIGSVLFGSGYVCWLSCALIW